MGAAHSNFAQGGYSFFFFFDILKDPSAYVSLNYNLASLLNYSRSL